MGHLAVRPVEHMVLLGDLNLHHPLWDEECNVHLFTRSDLEKSQVLIDVLAEFDLQMVLPKDTPTLQMLSTGNFMRPDNVFVSLLIMGNLIPCSTLQGERPARPDHL